VIPLAVVLTSAFNLGLNLIVVLVFMLSFGVGPMWSWLLFPVFLALLFVFTTAVSMIVSSLNPRFRDIGIIWSVLSTVLFYATPVLYPMESVDSPLRDFLALNPLTPLFALARTWMIDPTAPGPVDAVGAGPVAIAAAVYVGVCVLAAWVFKREAPRVAEEL
jgi:ABC-type polysaccharide/polyol phosphate export permease